MKKTIFFLILISIGFFTRPIHLNAQGSSQPEIFFNKDAVFSKNGDNRYLLSGSINKTKHKDTDPTPLETITVSAFFYTQPKTNSSSPFYSAKAIRLDDKYTFELNNPPLEQNTYYSIVISFEGNNGAKSEYLLKDVSTEKGIIPESGKARDDFFDKNSYRLLAPIPGMVALLDPALCQLEQTRNPGQICDINAFLNFLLSLAIGAAAVVLVVRIIISGYGYMVSDIPFVKAKLKGNFIEAMIGLLVALSAYLILNTVNPKLVSSDVKIGVAQFNIEEDENNIIKDDRFTINTTTRTNQNCKGKIVDVKTGNGSFVDACEEISEKIALMFLDAKRENIILSGGGFRTKQEQTVLYNQNCGGGTRRCSPPTARPGTSMHETGKAFDLKCDGNLITFSTPFKGTRNQSTKKCFDWLSKNAYKYGLINLKKENWHWSVNGR